MSGFERLLLPTLRGCLEGQRNLALMPFHTVGPFLRDTGKSKGTTWSSTGVVGFAETANSVEMKKYLETAGPCTGLGCWALQYATIGPGDLLYLPTGTFAAEQVKGKCDVIGFKISNLSFFDEFAEVCLRASLAEARLPGGPAVVAQLTEEALGMLQRYRSEFRGMFAEEVAARHGLLHPASAEPLHAVSGTHDESHTAKETEQSQAQESQSQAQVAGLQGSEAWSSNAPSHDANTQSIAGADCIKEEEEEELGKVEGASQHEPHQEDC